MRGVPRVPRRCAALAATCSLTAAATLALAAGAPPAAARETPGGGEMRLSPSSAAPGSTVSFFTTACTATATAATATSTAFEAITLKPGDGGLIGVGKVKSVSVGTYTVSISCSGGGGTVSTTFDVTDKEGSSGAMPSGPTKAGLGGSQGPDTAQVALGALLAAGAAGSVVYGVRRRSRTGA